ncbi:MAG TPA: MFS transporter [Elusimicrobiota bacterium]|nr:MFS transporter [Elusimicrobiota bacterium]
MKLLRGGLALVLAYALGVQPAVAQVVVRLNVPAVTSAGSAAAAGARATGSLSLPNLALTPSAALGPAAFAPAFAGAPSISVPQAALAAAPAALPAAAPALAASPLAAAAVVPAASAEAPRAAKALAPAERLTEIRVVADKAVENLDRADAGTSRGKADAQFAALTQERLAASAGDGVQAPSAKALADLPARAYLDKPAENSSGGEKADVPAPKPAKTGFFQVFKDPERNKAFWRYVKGYSIFLVGYEMYVVAQPYLISSMVTNALHEKHDSRAGDKAVVNELIRSDRSLSRIAQWGAQFFSYATIPLFTRNAEKDGPKKWLVKATFVRAAALASIAGVFFATGLIGTTALWVLFGLIAVQSFFQGIAITSEGAATTRLLGDKSVTSDERTRANSILTIIGSVISIIGPILAGGIALMGPIKGKAGVGGAVIYAVYAGAMALTAFIYAGIRMFAGPGANPEAANLAAPAPRTFKSVLGTLWTSIKDGTRIVVKDRMLRTMLILSTISSLFSDPLVFNVLPEYVEKLAATSSIGSLLHVPVAGWLLHTMTSTPMGNFALMVAMASVGSIVAALTIKPLTKLFQKFGFKTDEALTVPFYFLAALEAPLFFLMIHTPSILGAVALYGLQSLAVGYIGIAISGLYQKNLGGQKDENVNKILAADSLIGIAAAIISTVVYGFILTNIPIATSLIIAAAATGVVSLIRLAAPFLSFTRSQRKPPEPPAAPPTPPAHAMPSTGEHNGPNSILSTHL